MKLLIVDLSGVYRTFWHASEGKATTSAAASTRAAVARVSQGFDRVAYALDSPPYKRNELDPEYKANRVEFEQTGAEHFRALIAELEAEGAHCTTSASRRAASASSSTARRNLRARPLAVRARSAARRLREARACSAAARSAMGRGGRRPNQSATWPASPRAWPATSSARLTGTTPQGWRRRSRPR